MDIKIFIYAVVVFVFAFFLHVLVWRWLKPQRHMVPLFLVFAVIPILLFILFWFLSPGILSLSEFTLALILYLAFAGVYIQTYPPIQANCPSLFLTRLIGSRREGISLEDIRTIVSRYNLIKVDSRIKDLEEDGLLFILEDGQLKLTPKGRLLSNFFIFYRQKLLGLKEGAG